DDLVTGVQTCAFRSLCRQHRRLVRPQHGVEKTVRDFDFAGMLGRELREELLVPLAAVRLEKLGAPPPELPLRRAPHEVVTLPDELELEWIELLRFDEHLLT